MTPKYLEDFAAGQTFKTGSLRIDADSIKRFATEFDPQPFHLDETIARDTVFRGLAASGWHTAAVTMKLLLGSAFSPAGGIIGVGFEELRWPRPVRTGDELHVEAEILEVRPSKSNPGQGLVKLRTATVNQNHETVQLSVGSVVVPRRATTPPAS